jgi:hypothetical protein
MNRFHPICGYWLAFLSFSVAAVEFKLWEGHIDDNGQVHMVVTTDIHGASDMCETVVIVSLAGEFKHLSDCVLHVVKLKGSTFLSAPIQPVRANEQLIEYHFSMDMDLMNLSSLIFRIEPPNLEAVKHSFHLGRKVFKSIWEKEGLDSK